MLDVQFGQASERGRHCIRNEDSLGAFIPDSPQQARTHGFLFAIADSANGAELPETDKAISALVDEFGKAQPGTMLIRLLPELICAAHATTHNGSRPAAHSGKAATSLAACALRHDQAVVSHIGNARCYLVRNGQARQLTQDHTWARKQQAQEWPPHDKIAQSDRQSGLLSLIGTGEPFTADTRALTLLPGDVLVLCTDGLHGEMSTHGLEQIVSQQKNVHEMAHELVSQAREWGGNDNATALVIRVRSVEPAEMHRGQFDRPQM